MKTRYETYGELLSTDDENRGYSIVLLEIIAAKNAKMVAEANLLEFMRNVTVAECPACGPLTYQELDAAWEKTTEPGAYVMPRLTGLYIMSCGCGSAFTAICDLDEIPHIQKLMRSNRNL